MLIFYIQFHHFNYYTHTQKPTTFLIANKKKKSESKVDF